MGTRSRNYYKKRAKEIKLILRRNGLDPDYRNMLEGALFLAEWRLKSGKKINPKLN